MFQEGGKCYVYCQCTYFLKENAPLNNNYHSAEGNILLLRFYLIKSMLCSLLLLDKINKNNIHARFFAST